MPYKAVGAVKNATINAAVNLEVREVGVYICVYATGKYESAFIKLWNKNQCVLEEKTTISPIDIYEKLIDIDIDKKTDLKIEVFAGNQLLVAYQPKESKVEKLPEPAKPAKNPEEIMTNEELYLTGLHIEQYRHATYLPDPYYLEGLKRDEGDIRINNAYGALLMRRGSLAEAEKYFRKALERATWKNPNPYNSEPYYNLGLVLLFQGKAEEAFDAFFKATWSSEQQEMSFYYLAAIKAKKGEYDFALELVEKGLVKNAHNIKARGLKAYLLRKLSKTNQALEYIMENLEIDRFDYLSRFELSLLTEDKKEQIQNDMNRIMRNYEENYLQIARDYAEFGGYEEAIAILRECKQDKPMLSYYEAYYLKQLGEKIDNFNEKTDDINEKSKALIEKANAILKKAEKANSDYCFPNKLEDITVLKHAIEMNPNGAKAYYYLGNLYYDKLQYEVATRLWEKSRELDDSFPIVLRNLSLSYYNKCNEPQKAKESLEKAFALNTKDARIFLELDQLYKKLNVSFEERLTNYEQFKETFLERDDLYIEYVTLHNLLGRYEEAYDLLMKRTFHPWEGGEGKVTAQYAFALVELAKKAMQREEYVEAKDYLEKALVYPDNLGEGKLEGAKDNDIYYYLGCVLEKLQEATAANDCFEKACVGTDEPAGMMYYNDQPADMILYQGLSYLKLGKEKEAKSRFSKLIDYGERHLFDSVRIEYFAVSLPDFLIFDEDLNVKNQAHCYYLIGLGNLGLKDNTKAYDAFKKVLQLEHNHMNCRRYMNRI
jgi:tetratricopeptide (TPR) repeat protein